LLLRAVVVLALAGLWAKLAMSQRLLKFEAAAGE
jgi:hypothetical protein